eukprot:9430811-Alexandrium_andersonii.AAC.1
MSKGCSAPCNWLGVASAARPIPRAARRDPAASFRIALNGRRRSVQHIAKWVRGLSLIHI